MGRPIVFSCAVKGCEKHCDVVQCEGSGGVFFSVQQIFQRPLSSATSAQLWACCEAHKEATIEHILKDMPHRPRPKTGPAAAPSTELFAAMADNYTPGSGAELHFPGSREDLERLVASAYGAPLS